MITNKYFYFSLLSLCCIIIAACQPKKSHEHEEADSHEHETINEHDEHEALSFTHFEAGYEVYSEVSEWVVSEPAELVIHITRLDSYQPISAPSIKVSFESVNSTANNSEPGIFPVTLTPEKAGFHTLVISFADHDKSQTLRIDSIEVYSDDAHVPHNHEGESGLITYSKELAWKESFGLYPVHKEPFSRVIRTSGEILPAPGDETIITALHSGTISLRNKLIEGRKVDQGEVISTITSDLIHQNLTNDYLLAKNSFEKANMDYERSQKLINEKLISEKEFLESKLNYESAKNNFQNISKYYSDGNENVKAPIAGIIRSVFVREGQFIQEGTPIATIMQNKRVILKADVPQQYNNLTPGIYEANFIPVYSDKLLNTKTLNGKRISYSSALPANSLFTTVNFEFDANPDIIPGSYVQVYLKSAASKLGLVIPQTALMEDQGNYFVFVMHDGEHFKKTYITLGESDGENVEVLSGLQAGEYIVSKGAYKIHLALLSNAVPAHTHSH